MSTDFSPDEFLPEDRSDAAGPDDFMDIPGDDTGDVELPFAERVASALDGPDADWMRNTGFRTEADLVRSYREMQARATRAEQEREQVIQAFQSSEEAPDPYQQQQGDAQYAQAAAWLGDQVESGNMSMSEAFATLANAVLPELVDQRAEQIVGQRVAPLAQDFQNEQLGKVLNKMSRDFGEAEARKYAAEVHRMVRHPKYGAALSTPEGLEQAFYAVAGRHAQAERQRATRARGIETVDSTSRVQREQQNMADALEAWILKPGP